MSLTPDEKQLLATETPAPAKSRRPAAAEPKRESVKGPLSTAQHDDDGWGDTPIQMRG